MKRNIWHSVIGLALLLGMSGCGASTETQTATPTPVTSQVEEDEPLEEYSTLDLAMNGVRFSMGIPSREGYACEYDEESYSLYITRNGEDVAQGFFLGSEAVLEEMEGIRNNEEGYQIYRDEEVFALATTANQMTGFASEDGPIFKHNTPFLFYAIEEYDIGLIIAGLTSDEEFQSITNQLSIFVLPLS